MTPSGCFNHMEISTVVLREAAYRKWLGGKHFIVPFILHKDNKFRSWVLVAVELIANIELLRLVPPCSKKFMYTLSCNREILKTKCYGFPLQFV